jgi:hypothetical protein
MKIVRPLLLVLVAILQAGCVVVFPFGGLSGRADEDFSLSTPFADVGSLTVDWINGTVSVRIDESAEQITATGSKTVRAATDADAAANLDNLRIEITVAESFPTQVFLRFEAPTSTLLHTYEADVEIVLPGPIPLRVENVNGTATVTGNRSTTTVDLTNGEAVVSGQEGDSDVGVTNGTINIDSLSGSVTANCTNGEIDISARPTGDNAVNADVTTGAISIRIPADTAATVRLTQTVGTASIDSTLSAAGSFIFTFGEISGTLNGGGAAITAGATVGTVQLESL